MIAFKPIIAQYLQQVLLRNGEVTPDAMAEIWPLVVGQIFAARSRVLDYREETLFVEGEDQAWVEALEQQKAGIVDRINRLLPRSEPPISGLAFSVSVQLFSKPMKKSKARPSEKPRPLNEEDLSVIHDPELRRLVGRVVGRHRGLKRDE